VAVASLLITGRARGDDPPNAQSLLPSLEADTAHRAVTADAIRASRDALERATRLRTAGDEAHARLAEGLALEWAETARDLARAADAEKREHEIEVAAIDAGARVERERALLEAAIARAGRLATELQAAQQGGAKPRDRTAIESRKAPPAKSGPMDADAPTTTGPGTSRPKGKAR
jgi:hypothetical protein